MKDANVQNDIQYVQFAWFDTICCTVSNCVNPAISVFGIYLKVYKGSLCISWKSNMKSYEVSNYFLTLLLFLQNNEQVDFDNWMK